MSITTQNMDKNTLGIWYGIAAYTIWGILPLYWKLLQVIPALEILAHRIFWSFVFMALVVVVTRGLKPLLGAAANRKKLLLMFFAGVLISVNWLTYIYAVNNDFVIEASMGYFINPLVVVVLGVTVLKERLTRWQLTALILAGLGVLLIAVQYGRVPWIALFLAASFAAYGLIKKMVNIGSISGLTLETFIVMPVALVYIYNLEASGIGALNTTSFTTGLILAGTGVITATPLLLYARGIENTTFSMMGFLQYIAPSINLFLGVFIFREHFTFYHFLSFCLIWAALAIFTLANLGILKEPVLTSGKQVSN